MQFDALIVGGGPFRAYLGDGRHQRDLSSHAIHGLLGREGRSPAYMGRSWPVSFGKRSCKRCEGAETHDTLCADACSASFQGGFSS